MDRSGMKFILLSLSMLLVVTMTTTSLSAQTVSNRNDIRDKVKTTTPNIKDIQDKVKKITSPNRKDIRDEVIIKSRNRKDIRDEKLIKVNPYTNKEKSKQKQEKIIKKGKESVQILDVTEVKEDTAYYENAVRKNSWIVGMGKELTKQEAMALPHYYRMTKKNSKGHWEHIEAMSKEKPSVWEGSHLLYGFERDYYTPEFFDIMAICQWFCFSNIEEEELIEEWSCDEEGNLIASAQFNKQPDGRIVISYNGLSGLPIDLDEDTSFNYGNVFAVTYDEDGRDGMIEYFDGAGNPKPSSLGYYQERMKYDQNGEIIERSFHDQIGNLMNNNRGVAMEKRVIMPDGKLFVIKKYDKNLKEVTGEL